VRKQHKRINFCGLEFNEELLENGINKRRRMEMEVNWEESLEKVQ
jgi:hypothetical protein